MLDGTALPPLPLLGAACVDGDGAAAAARDGAEEDEDAAAATAVERDAKGDDAKTSRNEDILEAGGRGSNAV